METGNLNMPHRAARPLEGRVALVTGAGSGIGREAAIVMARQGARVLCVDVTGAEATAKAVAQAGGEARTAIADVTIETEVAAAVQAAVTAWGKLDCAFNNAGISPASVGSAGYLVADIPFADWNRLLAVNLTGVWCCMKYELAAMRLAGKGAIVNTASIAGLTGLPGAGAYVASKHGVVGLTKAAALDYAASGIRVNAVCPGFIDTPMATELRRRRGDEVSARIPAGRFGTATEIAEIAAWLCSDMAAYVTGSTITADGGFTAG